MRSRAEILIKETTTSKHTFDVAQPKLPRLTGEGRGEVATHRADCHPELDSGSINAGRETFKDKSLLTYPFNILFSSPSLVLEFKTEPINTKQIPAQGLRKQYIEQENNLPLSKGEDRMLNEHKRIDSILGEGSSRRVPFCERSEQNNFPFSTFNFPFKGGELC